MEKYLITIIAIPIIYYLLLSLFAKERIKVIDIMLHATYYVKDATEVIFKLSISTYLLSFIFIKTFSWEGNLAFYTNSILLPILFILLICSLWLLYIKAILYFNAS